MTINIIAAQTKTNVIGNHNKVPWRLRNDFIRLKSLTMGRIVILGRKTYDSLAGYYERSGRPMPAKLYIVVTRQSGYELSKQNTKLAFSFEKALVEANKHSPEIFVIGGAQVFEQALPLADRLYITEVNADIKGDTFFPKTNPKDWVERTRERHYKNEDHDHDYHFVIFDRIKK